MNIWILVLFVLVLSGVRDNDYYRRVLYKYKKTVLHLAWNVDVHKILIIPVYHFWAPLLMAFLDSCFSRSNPSIIHTALGRTSKVWLQASADPDLPSTSLKAKAGSFLESKQAIFTLLLWNGNGSQRLIYCNTWSMIGGTVWEGSGSMAFLREVCHWGGALKFQKPRPFIAVSLPALWLLSWHVGSQLLIRHHACLSVIMLSAPMAMESPSEPASKTPIKCFLS